MPAKNGFQLQGSDIELLHFVHELRIATIDHLAALSGRSVRALWGRLHKLTERRYLTSVARFMQKPCLCDRHRRSPGINGEGVRSGGT
jgi:hypothetical protein